MAGRCPVALWDMAGFDDSTVTVARAYASPLRAAIGRNRVSIRPQTCSQNLQNSGIYSARRDLEKAYGDGQAEPPRARAPGIHVQHPIPLRNGGLVRMARDYDLKPRRDGIEIQLLDVVQNVDPYAADLERGGGRYGLSPGTLVVVASHSIDGGDLPQRVQDLRSADVTSVNDALYARERGHGLRAQESMGVGNEADGDAGRAYRGSMRWRFRHK